VGLGRAWIDLHGFAAGGVGLLQVVGAGVEIHVEKGAAVGNTSVSARILWIDDDGAGEHLPSELEPLLAELIEELPSLEIVVIGLNVHLGRLLDDRLAGGGPSHPWGSVRGLR